MKKPLMTSTMHSGASRLFNGVSLCPPIDQKTLFSPPINSSKSLKARDNGSSCSNNQADSNGSSGGRRTMAPKALQNYGNCAAFSLN